MRKLFSIYYNPTSFDILLEYYKLSDNKFNINIQNKNGYTILHKACAVNDMHAVKYLCHIPGINVTLRTNNNETPYDIAKRKGSKICEEIMFHQMYGPIISQVIGITGIIGYEAEINHCIGLCKATQVNQNLLAMVAQLHTFN